MEISQIKTFLDSPAGKSLKDYLTFRLREMGSIENIQEFSTTAMQALEIKSQRRAYLKIKQILGDLASFSEEPRGKDERDDFNVM